MNQQALQSTVQSEPVEVKKDYHSPQLLEYGTVRELTQATNAMDGELDFQTFQYSTSYSGY